MSALKRTAVNAGSDILCLALLFFIAFMKFVFCFHKYGQPMKASDNFSDSNATAQEIVADRESAKGEFECLLQVYRL